jgi:arylsulfatase A-like enzyme
MTNIILVVSDTFRRDHLPCYGAEHVIAPHLTAFANEAQVFEDAYAASFPTVCARADLMTGRYTFTYQQWAPLEADEITLAQSLRQAGYLTTAVVDTPFLLRNGYAYDRGFHDFFWIRGQRDGRENEDVLMQRKSESDHFAPKTFQTAIDWLERHHSEPFFLYIDTWDPHEPWDPPEHYVTPYYPDYAGEVIDPLYWDWREDGYTQQDIDIAHACYRGEISMVDHWFGKLMAQVEHLGIADDTIVIFLSDHGYYFGEHGLLGKSRFRWSEPVTFMEGCRMRLKDGSTHRSPLHNEVTRVPLLIKIPGQAAARIPGVVSLPDIMPTILHLANTDIPDRVQARSLVPMMAGSEPVHDIVVTSYPLEKKGDITRHVDDRARKVVEISPSTITDGDWDLMFAVSGEPVELYRARADEGHSQNVIDQYPDVARALHFKFVEFLEAMGTSKQFLDPRRSLWSD